MFVYSFLNINLFILYPISEYKLTAFIVPKQTQYTIEHDHFIIGETIIKMEVRILCDFQT